MCSKVWCSSDNSCKLLIWWKFERILTKFCVFIVYLNILIFKRTYIYHYNGHIYLLSIIKLFFSGVCFSSTLFICLCTILLLHLEGPEFEIWTELNVIFVLTNNFSISVSNKMEIWKWIGSPDLFLKFSLPSIFQTLGYFKVFAWSYQVPDNEAWLYVININVQFRQRWLIARSLVWHPFLVLYLVFILLSSPQFLLSLSRSLSWKLLPAPTVRNCPLVRTSFLPRSR